MAAAALPGDAWAPHPSPPYDHGALGLRDGRELGYALYGAKRGRDVFWFHGTPGGRFQVPPRIGEVATGMGMRVVALERPGVGLSTVHRYTRVVEWAADVAAAADHLGIDRFGIVGLSGGGPYVLACAHELPDRVVAGVLFGGIGPTRGADAVPSYTRALPLLEPILSISSGVLGTALGALLRKIRPVSQGGIDFYTRYLSGADRPAFEKPGMKDMFINDLCAGMERSLHAPVFDLTLFGRHWGFELENVKAPVLLYQGDHDHIVPFSHGEWQAQRIPVATLLPRPGEAHFAGFLEPEAVLGFIDGHWDKSPAATKRAGAARRSAPSKKSTAKPAPRKARAAKKNAPATTAKATKTAKTAKKRPSAKRASGPRPPRATQ